MRLRAEDYQQRRVPQSLDPRQAVTQMTVQSVPQSAILGVDMPACGLDALETTTATISF